MYQWWNDTTTTNKMQDAALIIRDMVHEQFCCTNATNDDVIKSVMASRITSLTIVYSTFYSGADQREHQSSASSAFVLGIHRWPVNSPHKWPVTRKMFPFDDVIMFNVMFQVKEGIAYFKQEGSFQKFVQNDLEARERFYWVTAGKVYIYIYIYCNPFRLTGWWYSLSMKMGTSPLPIANAINSRYIAVQCNTMLHAAQQPWK